MKKKKNILIVLIIIFIITVLTISITKFIKSFNEDAIRTQELITTIKTNYTELNENITSYNAQKEKLSNEIASYYQETLTTNYPNLISSLNEYEQIIQNIQKNINKIQENCQDNTFQESQVNSICQNIEETYNQIMTSYIKDIDNFNNIIETYNQTNTNKLEKFNSKIINNYKQIKGEE